MSRQKANKSAPPLFQRPRNEDEYRDFRGFFRVYFRNLKRYMITGLMVWIPLIVTLWLTWWVITTAGFGLERFFQGLVVKAQVFGARWPALSFMTRFEYRPGFGFLTAILLFLTTGFITRYIVGRKLIATGEWLLGKIPFVNRVYTAAQQIRDVFVSRKGSVVQQVVLFEYPRPGVYRLGLVTSTDRGAVQKALGGSNHVAVFVPNTPNAATGFLFYADPKELVPLEIGVEEAMKSIVSGGAYMPGRKFEGLDFGGETEDEDR